MNRTKKVMHLCVSAATAPFNGGAHDGEPYDELMLFFQVVAFTSGTLTPFIDGSPDNGVTWFRFHTGTGRTATGTYIEKTSGPLPILWRCGVEGTFAGTAKITSQCGYSGSGG